MTRDAGESIGFELAQSSALVKLDDGVESDLSYSDAENARANRKKLLTWCGIGLGAAIIVPLFIYFAPHVF